MSQNILHFSNVQYLFGTQMAVFLKEAFKFYLETDVYREFLEKLVILNSEINPEKDLYSQFRFISDLEIHGIESCKNIVTQELHHAPVMHDNHNTFCWAQSIPLFITTYTDGHTYKKYAVPFQYLIKGCPDIVPMFGYKLELLYKNETTFKEHAYYGITGRHWATRLNEHIQSAIKGSMCTVHRTLRDFYTESSPYKEFRFILQPANRTKENIMLWEEESIKPNFGIPWCLNQIPGGYEGLRLLHKLGITSKYLIKNTEVDRAKEDFAQRINKESTYTNDTFLKQVASQPSWLKENQVKLIRELNDLAYDPEEILKISGARNIGQVKNCINSKTFERLH